MIGGAVREEAELATSYQTASLRWKHTVEIMSMYERRNGSHDYLHNFMDQNEVMLFNYASSTSIIIYFLINKIQISYMFVISN